MNLCVLASGSSGNCLAVWNDHGGLLVDCGISYRQIVARMAKRDIKPEWFSVILVSHAHGDHTKGLGRWCLHHSGTIFCTERTSEAERVSYGSLSIIGIRDVFQVAGFTVQVRPVVHNCEGACTFFITEHGTKLAIIGETGRITPELAEAAKGCTVLAIEANHSRQMLAENPKLPVEIMERIAVSHLSNAAAANFMKGLGPETKLVIALHRSRDNNTAEACRESLQSGLNNARISLRCRLVLAEQHEATEVFDV